MYESKLNQIDKRLELVIGETRQAIKAGNYNTQQASSHKKSEKIDNADA